MLVEPTAYNTTNGWIAGQWYRAVILGNIFEFWYPRPLNRREARKAALRFAGGESVYSRDEIESVRAIKRPSIDG